MSTIPVKICGLRDPDAALACAAAGAAAIGLVFHPKSPRAVDPPTALAVVSALPDMVTPVGVFVDQPVEKLLRICAQTRIRCAQLHGSESPEMVERLVAEGLRVVKVLHETGSALLAAARRYAAADAFLVECGRGMLPGGNGEAWDWSGARELGPVAPFALAGGLTADNLIEALKAARPDAVDVSSGVESAPGIKDLRRVREFLKLAGEYQHPATARRVFNFSAQRTWRARSTSV